MSGIQRDITLIDFANTAVVRSNIAELDLISSRFNSETFLNTSIIPTIDNQFTIGNSNFSLNNLVSGNCSINVTANVAKLVIDKMVFRNSTTGNINYTGNLVPTEDDQYFVGFPSKRWKRMVVGDLEVANVNVSGTITGNLGNSGNISFPPETRNFVFSGPPTGSDAVPTFRRLVPGDLPYNIVTDTLVADQNNYNPTGLSTAVQLRLTASGATRTITGLQSYGSLSLPDINQLMITNIGASFNVILSSLNANSTASNQFQFDGRDVVLVPGQSNVVFYDYTTMKWRSISASPVNIFGGSFTTSGVISPAALSSNQNNYSPTGISNATIIRLSATTVLNITGLVGGINGRRIVLVNTSNNPITLVNQSLLSTAANRFLLGGSNVTLVNGSVVNLVYDGVDSRWRVQGGTGGAAAGGLIQSKWVEVTTDLITSTTTWPSPNTTINAAGSLPQATITVISTAGFPTAGVIWIQTSNNGSQAVTYTGTTATTFTGCTGGSGGLVVGAFVWAAPLTTTIAAGSNGQTLPQSTLNVVSTAGFPASGRILVASSVGTDIVFYTGTTATTFTGCTGGTGSLTTGGTVKNVSPTPQDIMNIEMTTSGGAMIISAGASATTKNNTTAYFQVLVDGVVRRGGSTRGNGSAPSGSTIIGLKLSDIAAGAHVVVVRWRVQNVSNPDTRIYPVTLSEDNNASLLVQEVSS